jgi:hypothetical protein
VYQALHISDCDTPEQIGLHTDGAFMAIYVATLVV